MNLAGIFDIYPSLMAKQVKPYDPDKSKKEQVEAMFDNIASGYDSLNRFLSLGIDKIWRKKAIAKLQRDDLVLLDVATGTADMAIQMTKDHPCRKVYGLDVSAEMLRYGQEKIEKKDLDDKIKLVKGDSEDMPFEEDKFDGSLVAFGVRNFENLDAGLKEMYRVTKPEGKIIVLEFSKPRIFGFKQLFQFYFRFILPTIGRIKSKDPRAYKYLFESVQSFPDYDDFLDHLRKAGFTECSYDPLSLGICSIYTGVKPS